MSNTPSRQKMTDGDNRGHQRTLRLIKTHKGRRKAGKAVGKKERSLGNGGSLLRRNIYSPGASSGGEEVKFWQN